MNDLTIPELNVPFTFKQRPLAIPPDLRPEWRVGMVLLILKKCCRGYRSSFARLHVLSWASRTPENGLALREVINHQLRPDALLVRIEPALNRAVDLAAGEGLLKRVTGDRVELTPAGVLAAEGIDKNEDIFTVEREYLTGLGRKVTEDSINQLFSSYKGVS
jgi:hypothetical protein